MTDRLDLDCYFSRQGEVTGAETSDGSFSRSQAQNVHAFREQFMQLSTINKSHLQAIYGGRNIA
jgi:hypothetical protein